MDPVYLTAWLTTVLFLGSRLGFPEIPSRWTERFGVASLYVHILVAYAWSHDWSHTEATLHVAERTEQMVGLKTGVGIYANFLVALVWTWIAWTKQSSGHVRTVAEIFLWLMFFCASVVFAQWLSALLFLPLWGLAAWATCRKASNPHSAP